MERAEANNGARVLSAYVRSMVRAEDAEGSVGIEEYDGITALALREKIEDGEYVTWLYPYEGQLYEMFTEAEYGFVPDRGTAICGIQSFEPSLQNGLLTVEMTGDTGDACTVQVALRCADSSRRGESDGKQ